MGGGGGPMQQRTFQEALVVVVIGGCLAVVSRQLGSHPCSTLQTLYFTFDILLNNLFTLCQRSYSAHTKQ